MNIIAPIHIATEGLLAPISDMFAGVVIDKPILMATRGWIILLPPPGFDWLIPIEWIGEWDPDP